MTLAVALVLALSFGSVASADPGDHGFGSFSSTSSDPGDSGWGW